MKNPFSKTPFLFLSIPLLLGILLQYYLILDIKWSISISLLGVVLILLSFIPRFNFIFKWRWLFGAGVFIFLLAIGGISTQYQQSQMRFDYDAQEFAYRGIIVDLPQVKKKSIAYNVYLPDQDKTIICYFSQSDSLAANLLPSNEFLFSSPIQAFSNFGNFDYARYMYNRGFVGSSYIPSHQWLYTNKDKQSLQTLALRCRLKILTFYSSLGFDENQLGILSALTLGDRRGVTDDLNQSFRVTGTVHILSVSGLHVGIIYAIISSLLCLIRRSSKYYFIKPLVIIILLWIYSFITGLPPSVIRASIMLTVFCFADIFRRKSYSVNALYIAAFFMLLINPFSFFDIGFQLSFISVLSILYVYPNIFRSVKVKNVVLRSLCQLSILSISAQLATFPLCLYYFGTFPTYFLIGNLIIVPLVSLIMYSFLGLIVAFCLNTLFPSMGTVLYYLPTELLKLLVDLMLKVANIIEGLPYANVDNAYISFIEFLIISLSMLSVLFFFKRKSRFLIMALSAVFLLISISIYQTLQ